MTLYTGVLSKRWGGRNTRDGFRNTWSRGMKLGTAACGDEKCLADWTPFAAPADAPGDHRGQLTFDCGTLGGTAADLERMWFLDQTGGDRAYGGAGIYWALERP